MLEHKKYSLLIIFLFMIFFIFSCENKKLSYGEINISTAPYIKKDALNLKDFSIDVKPDPGSRYSLNIVIYSYTQGKETISLVKNGEFAVQTGAAELKALVKIMDGKKLMRAEFVEVSGNSNDELVRNLAKSVSGLGGH
ncbi:MAG TPA: hypothetical protein P5120_06220 [Spirochaetota bacterium]|nr:hypothetical protein [Spirochaetota bacterium]HPF06426.1 hypothetical protein [Spirochaetota bacterium]HPJ41646.1 hypothetical protein [Spirochaetota bacterium]HPR36682.1 hypothetical protein [Spirochaetota bacterium]HRX47094.1 hypothetical protein [Spirochaetota bacterium]